MLKYIYYRTATIYGCHRPHPTAKYSTITHAQESHPGQSPPPKGTWATTTGLPRTVSRARRAIDLYPHTMVRLFFFSFFFFSYLQRRKMEVWDHSRLYFSGSGTHEGDALDDAWVWCCGEKEKKDRPGTQKGIALHRIASHWPRKEKGKRKKRSFLHPLPNSATRNDLTHSSILLRGQ